MADYKLRPLEGGDIWTLLDIVSKLDIKEEVIEIIERNTAAIQAPIMQLKDHQKKKPTKVAREIEEAIAITERQETYKRGIKAVITLIFKGMSNSSKVKDEVNALLGDLAGLTAEKTAKLPLKDYISLITQLVQSEDIGSFFDFLPSAAGETTESMN
jgi:hypothetical protein